jgi:hypothetical protein
MHRSLPSIICLLLALGALLGSVAPASAQDTSILVSITASSNAEFTVSLSSTSTTDSVIAYDVGGTAIPGTDYTALSGSVTVNAGTDSTVIPVIASTTDDESKTVTVTLSSITSGDALLAIDPDNSTASINIGNGNIITTGVHPIIYKLDFDKNGSSTINFNFFDNGFVIGPYEGSALVGLGSFIFTLNNSKEYFLVEDSAHMFIAKKGSAKRMVFGGGSIGEAGFSGYLGTGSVNTSLSVPGITLKIAKSMKGATLAGADETSLLGTINEPADGTLSLAGNIDVKASLREGFTRQANAVEGAGSLADATQLVVDYLESSGFVRSDPIEASIAGTQDGDRITDVDGEFTVSLSRASSTDSTFSYSVDDTSTAVAGTDYTAASITNTVTVPAGDTSATIDIDVITSATAGEPKTLTLSLTGVTDGDALLNIESSTGTASIEITNGPVASIGAGETASRSGSDSEFTVFISPVSTTLTEITLTVTVTGTLGDNISNTDFTELPTSVSIAAESGSTIIPLSLMRGTGADGVGTVTVEIGPVTTPESVTIDSTSSSASIEITD